MLVRKVLGCWFSVSVTALGAVVYGTTTPAVAIAVDCAVEWAARKLATPPWLRIALPARLVPLMGRVGTRAEAAAGADATEVGRGEM